MKIEKAKKILEKAGFTAYIDKDNDGLISLEVNKNGVFETFYDCKLKNHCANYLCEFDSSEQLINFANKSIELALKDLNLVQ